MIRYFLAAALLLSTTAHAQKYYFTVRGIDEAPGVSSGIADEAKRLFVEELGRHPEITLTPPPSGSKLRAFEVTLKILSVTRAIDPPPAGKQYRVLRRGVKLSVFGDTVPEKLMAIGGDGEAEIGEEVGRQDDLDKRGKALLLECAKTAVKQAVDMTITKLELAEKPEKRKKKKTK